MLELVVQAVQDPSAVKDEGGFQHGFMDPLIVQLREHIPLCADHNRMGVLTSLVWVCDDGD